MFCIQNIWLWLKNRQPKLLIQSFETTFFSLFALVLHSSWNGCRNLENGGKRQKTTNRMDSFGDGERKAGCDKTGCTKQILLRQDYQTKIILFTFENFCLHDVHAKMCNARVPVFIVGFFYLLCKKCHCEISQFLTSKNISKATIFCHKGLQQCSCT